MNRPAKLTPLALSLAKKSVTVQTKNTNSNRYIHTLLIGMCGVWITSGQSNLTKGRIAPAHESFNSLQPENVSFVRFQN